MTPETIALIRQLIDVGTGKITHHYVGLCPDKVEGHETRDKHCPACQILIKAENLCKTQDS